jgi:hypothetical protein
VSAERLEALLENLFSLEVNTIVKENMTATKMPNTAHALLDVGRDYALSLCRLRAPKPLPDWISLEVLDDLRTRAQARANVIQGLPADSAQAQTAPDPGKDLTDEEAADLLLLYRIRDTSDQLKGLFLDDRGAPRQGEEGKPLRFDRARANVFTDADLPLTDQQRLLLRKAWEISTEEVVMQTVIYLDGDVITRIRGDYARPDKRAMLEVHQAAVSTSISFWRGLVDVVRSIFTTFAGAKSSPGAP